MAPQSVELCDLQTLMHSLRLASPSSLCLAASVTDLRHDLGRDGISRFPSIQEGEDDEEDQHAAIAAGKQGTHSDESLQLLPLPLSSSSSSSTPALPLPQSIAAASTGALVTSAPTSSRQIMKCMCSSALILFSVTALLLLLPVVLPPLPPPPSELMLLPVAILLLLVCAALMPLSPRPTPPLPSAASISLSQPIPSLPFPQSLPLRLSMPL